MILQPLQRAMLAEQQLLSNPTIQWQFLRMKLLFESDRKEEKFSIQI